MIGELKHDPDEGFIKSKYANISLADMVIEATFTNPYSSDYHSWDYGFIIREQSDASGGSFIEIIVTSGHLWSVLLRDTNFPGGRRLGGATLLNLSTDTEGENHLRVVAIGERGWFFVNDEFVSIIDLSGLDRSGDAAIITGALAGNEVEGKTVRFEDFTIAGLSKRYGPARGKLEDKSELMAKRQTDVWTRDLVVESVFSNQRGGFWSYGFIIRETESDRSEAVGVTGRHQWFHETRNVDGENYTRVEDGFVSHVGARVKSLKHLLLIAVGDIGWLFLNDVLAAQLNLSHNMNSGYISVMGDFFQDHQGSPEFEGFNVWAP